MRGDSLEELIPDAVVKAATSSRYHVNKQSTLCQLRISNMKLHGREDDMKLLRGKLLELKNIDDSRKKAKDANCSNVRCLYLYKGYLAMRVLHLLIMEERRYLKLY